MTPTFAAIPLRRKSHLVMRWQMSNYASSSVISAPSKGAAILNVRIPPTCWCITQTGEERQNIRKELLLKYSNLLSTLIFLLDEPADFCFKRWKTVISRITRILCYACIFNANWIHLQYYSTLCSNSLEYSLQRCIPRLFVTRTLPEVCLYYHQWEVCSWVKLPSQTNLSNASKSLGLHRCNWVGNLTK